MRGALGMHWTINITNDAYFPNLKSMNKLVVDGGKSEVAIGELQC